ncbi:MAG: DegV family protein [Bavariicoccus seileri]|uniref:DegV family protein n=3 Tax=Bavariicoccus seileri TaxID=549685 RepID=A0A3D4S6T0_9ENTE|nr:DegV family protein [Bavariicoccus seileri]HCS93661.1 DegV family protein [Bavariicoccus seileri]
MTAIKIVTDSTVDLTDAELKKLDLTIVPLNINFEHENFIDGVTITKEEFIKKMSESQTLPKTSQPSIGEFVEVYNDLTSDGSTVISIHLTDVISGTINAAQQAAQLADGDVRVINSKMTSRGLARQVLRACELSQTDASVSEILTEIQKVHDKTFLYLDVIHLDNLVKGGRISKAAGLISNLLNIKVFMQLTDTTLVTIGKGRGMKVVQKHFDLLRKDYLSSGKAIKAIDFAHAGLSQFNQAIIDSYKKSFPNIPITVTFTSPVITTHTGADAMAIIIEEL